MHDISDKKAIEQLIPHRDPFLFIDEVVSCDQNGIHACKTVDAEMDFFRGHYPDRPIMPGVLLCECVFQSAAIFMASEKRVEAPGVMDKVPVVTRIQNVKFRKPVYPGDELHLYASMSDVAGEAYYFKGRIECEQKKIMTVEFTCMLAKLES